MGRGAASGLSRSGLREGVENVECTSTLYVIYTLPHTLYVIYTSLSERVKTRGSQRAAALAGVGLDKE